MIFFLCHQRDDTCRREEFQHKLHKTSPLATASIRLRPGHALLGFRHRRNTFIKEALNARAGVGLGGVKVALRIGIQVMDTEELAWLPSSITEAG